MAIGPDNVTAVFEPAPPPAAETTSAPAVDRALQILDDRAGLTVLINDPQRRTQSRRVLSDLVGRRGPQGIRILVAAGAHHFDEPQRRDFERQVLGDLPLRVVTWHDARSPRLLPIGPAGQWRGHPWLVDPVGILAVGSVEPHYFAGFTGAHKTATIGCASHGDITANHAAALDPHSRPCHLAGNPVHEGIARMLQALREQAAVAGVDLVQVGDRPVAAFAGEPLAALEQARQTAMEIFVRQTHEPADAIVAEVAGPLGRTFYQAEKAIKNNEQAVRDGGAIVLVAPCDGGIGDDRFVGLLEAGDSYEQAMERLRCRGYRLGDHKAVRLCRLSDPHGRNVRVLLVSPGLCERDANRLGFSRYGTVEQALSAAGVRPAADRVYWIRDAANMVVRVAEP